MLLAAVAAGKIVHTNHIGEEKRVTQHNDFPYKFSSNVQKYSQKITICNDINKLLPCICVKGTQERKNIYLFSMHSFFLSLSNQEHVKIYCILHFAIHCIWKMLCSFLFLSTHKIIGHLNFETLFRIQFRKKTSLILIWIFCKQFIRLEKRFNFLKICIWILKVCFFSIYVYIWTSLCLDLLFCRNLENLVPIEND